MHSKIFKGLYKMSGSQFWWFRYTRDGQRHAVSLRTPDEMEAILRAQAILAEGLLAAQQYNPVEPPERKREIHGLIERYLQDSQMRHKKPLRNVTADTRRYILKKFVTDCGIYHVGQITLPKIHGWLARLQQEGKSKDTCWTYGQRVRSFVQYLIPKYLPSSILNDFTLPEPAAKGRKNGVHRDEVTRSSESINCDDELKFALLCGFDAGLRREEVSEARVSWFDLENRLLHVTNNGYFVTKDRDNRAIPLTDRFVEFLKGYLAGRNKSEYVLAPKKVLTGKSKYRYDTNKRVRSHFLRLGIECTYHDMRRSFASNRVTAGQSIYKVAAWLGD
jgi:integrase